MTNDGPWDPADGPDPAAAFVDQPWMAELPDDLPNRWADEVAFYETTFLRMQREIFVDMGPQHQAWNDGGLPALEEMYEAGYWHGAAIRWRRTRR